MTAFAPPRGRQPSIEWVPIGDLLIDDSYQRSIETKASQALIRGIAAGWDWDVLDVLKVSIRPDFHHYVIDGQHRRAAAALRGDIAHLPCVMKRCAGPAEEARLFIAANRGRKATNRLDDFHAAVTAGDEQAATIACLVEGAGLTVARAVVPAGQAPGELTIVAPLRRGLVQRGSELVGQVLHLLGLAFAAEPITAASPLFGALLDLVALSDHDPADLLRTLRTGTSREWAEWGVAAATGMAGFYRNAAMRAAIEQRLAAMVSTGLPPPPDPVTSRQHASTPARQHASTPARQHASTPARQPVAAPCVAAPECADVPGAPVSLTVLESRVLAAIERAAEANAPCPENGELCDRLGVMSPSSVSGLFKSLEAKGVILIKRFASAREVEIIATGKRTSHTGSREPHWRTRGASVGSEVAAEGEDAARRRKDARRLSSTTPRRVPVTDQHVEPETDRPRVDRDPCPRCGARGDFACGHARSVPSWASRSLGSSASSLT